MQRFADTLAALDDVRIVIDMSRLCTIHSVQSDRLVVEAGATWSEVLAATLPQGLTPPVLTDYLELSGLRPPKRDETRR